MRSEILVSIFIVQFSSGCDNTGSQSQEIDASIHVDAMTDNFPRGFSPPPPPDRGVQILGERFTVQPGEDVFMCLYLPETLSNKINVSEMSGYQMAGGHHLILSWVIDSYQPTSKVHVCDDSEMTNHRTIGVASSSVGLKPPAGVAFEAPAGKRLVIQSHYINATDAPVDVMDAINLVEAEEEITDFAGMMVLNDPVLELPPGQTTVREMTCTVSELSNVFMLTGHTHEWGQNFSLELLRKDSDEIETLYEVAVGTGFRNEPPLLELSGDNLLVLQKGDRLRMRCEWFNSEDSPIYFPKEMCSAPLFYYPSRGFELCSQDGASFSAAEI